MTPFRIVVLAVLGGLACGPDGSASGDRPPTTKAPARSGEVWTIDQPEDRVTGPGALLAYLHGLHTVVLDGNKAYAGMTRLDATRDPDGNRTLALADGLTATLVPEGKALQLRFSTGESVALRKREAP